MNFKKLLFLILVFIILMLFTSCNSSEPVRIGFIAALSGRHSELGVSSREALIILTKKWNDAGGIHGRRIELIFADDQSTPEIGLSEMKRFAGENLTAVIGPFTSNMMPAVKLPELNNLLIISPTIATSQLSGLDDNFIRLIPSSSEQGEYIANLMKIDGISTAAVAYDISNLQYSEDVKNSFETEFRQLGGEISLLYPYDSSKNPSFKDLPLKLQKEGAQAVLLISSGMDAAAMAQQIRKDENTLQIYGSRWTKTKDLIEAGGKAVEGMKVISTKHECSDPESEDFIREFKERTGTEPIFAAVYTFETAKILFNVLKNTRDSDIQTIKNAIIGKTHRGFCEDIVIDEFGDTKRERVFAVVKNGRFENGE